MEKVLLELYYGFMDFCAIVVAAKSQTYQLKEKTKHTVKEKGQICSQILEKQKRIATLESDSYALTQVMFIFYFLTVQTKFHSSNK